jgi:hypothetical protein
MFEHDSRGAQFVIVLLTASGVAAGIWYQGRLFDFGLRLRFWQAALTGLLCGVFVAAAVTTG